MKYMGSKSRIAKYIVPIIQDYIDKNSIKTYIEPFVGGANVIDKIMCEQRIGSDNNEFLIELYKNLDKVSQLPNYIDKEEYSKVRNCFNEKSHDYEKWYLGAVGFLASYNGRFFDGGYSGLVTTKVGTVRNYYDEARRNLISQSINLKDVNFIYADYTYYNNYKNCLFYCDPPYQGTKQYGTSKNFNYEKFWDWVRSMSAKNIVLVSEYNAPTDFKYIFAKSVTTTIDNNSRKQDIERLFVKC